MRFLHAYLWVGGCIYLLTKENIDNIFKYIIILNKARVTGSVSITRLVGQCIIICRGWGSNPGQF